jgi:outer membrane protein assembly factor BamB
MRFKANSTALSLALAALAALLAIAPARAMPPAEKVLDDFGVQGGLVIHVGCGDGEQTAALRRNDAFLVHGLDADPAAVDKARARADALGLAGSVAFDTLDGRRLPHVSNLANLVIVEQGTSLDAAEAMRVLRPGGAALIERGGRWTTKTKPWPENIDQWTHYLHSAGNNAVAEDTVVGPPRHFQWISGPRFSRSHDHLASTSAVVTAGGRLFSIVDEGSIAFAAARAQWRLVARDAFNGVQLWERAIDRWEYHLRDFRAGPADIARRLVAEGDRVYVTLGYGEPVTALDAATGETLQSYEGTKGTREILLHNGTLLLVRGQTQNEWQAERAKEIVTQKDYAPPFHTVTPPAHQMQVLAVDAESGRKLWACADVAHDVMPSTLAADGDGVFFQTADEVVCLDGETGKVRWQTPRPVHRQRLAWSTPTLVVYDGVVLSADRRAEQKEGELLWIPSGGYHQYLRGEGIQGELIAMDAKTGQRLWSCPAYEGFNAPVDVLIADGLVWTGRYAWGNDPGITEGRDPKTGEVVRRRPSDREFLPRIGHARCHRAKATSKYLVLGRRGVEFVDVQSGDMVANFFVRGVCQYGVLPANGLLYAPPHSCACWVADLLKSGFLALAPERPEQVIDDSQPGARLHKGPAYGSQAQEPTGDEADAWPTYRGDVSRSGSTAGAVPASLDVAWTTELGDKLTSPVIAGGKLLVAEPETHEVHALDAATGEVAWTFRAGARVDSPPTIDRGRALLGAADGWVYCVRLDDGALVWKFRAAPAQRRIVVDDRLESPWPVSGSVLVLDGAVYFAAGRTSYLDGGMFLCKLDAATGRELKIENLEVAQAKRDAGVASGGHLPDVLSSDGDSIFMRNARFDRDLKLQKSNVPHLWSSVGFLDDSWWHRTYWQYGTSMRSGWGGWPQVGLKVPSGRLLVSDGRRVFGYGRNQYDNPGAHVGVDAAGVWGPIRQGLSRWTFYRLFSRDIVPEPGKEARRRAPNEASDDWNWRQQMPLLVQAMVLADNALLVAGSEVEAPEVPHDPREADPMAEALESDPGGRLVAVSPQDGQPQAELALPSSPVFDGMAVAGGRVYVSTRSGQVVCLTGEK